MKIAAIIPVKSFANAKTRMNLDTEVVKELCSVMLREVLHTVAISIHIHHTFVVTQEEQAAKIVKEFSNNSVIYDKLENGVNEAVALADKKVVENGYDASIVMPQDIPYIKTQDIDFVMRFAMPPNFAVIVPSRKFDGTNMLIRMPADLMGTHYDDDSYKEHVKMANARTKNAAPVFARRIMMDVDTINDLEFLLANGQEKPHVADMIKKIVKKTKE